MNRNLYHFFTFNLFLLLSYIRNLMTISVVTPIMSRHVTRTYCRGGACLQCVYSEVHPVFLAINAGNNADLS